MHELGLLDLYFLREKTWPILLFWAPILFAMDFLASSPRCATLAWMLCATLLKEDDLVVCNVAATQQQRERGEGCWWLERTGGDGWIKGEGQGGRIGQRNNYHMMGNGR